MSRTCFRNKQPFWYALYAGTVEDYREDEYGNPLQVGTHATYETLFRPARTSHRRRAASLQGSLATMTSTTR